MLWAEELKKAMNMLGEHPDTLFLGQSVAYPGHILFQTLEGVPASKKLELPVLEDAQAGMSLGLFLSGFIPVSIYPRLDFLIIACNQVCNHLDKWESMTGQAPHVIIRSMVGSITPLNPGPQHSQDHTSALKLLLPHFRVVKLTRPEDVVPAYREALATPGPWLLIEAPEKRRGYD